MAITGAAGGGNWSVGASWVGGVAPTAADDVLLTVTSGNITIDGTSGAPNLCRSLTCTGYTGTLTHASAKQLNVGDGTAGAFLLVSGMTYSPNAAAVLKFVSTTTGNNITWAGKSPPLLTFDGVGGAWQFQDNAGTANTALLTLTNGTLDTNGKTLSCPFSSNGSATRALTLGATVWTLGITGGTIWDVVATGMTLSAGSSTLTINVTNNNSIMNMGTGLTYGTVQNTALSAGSVTINNDFNCATLTLSQGAAVGGRYILGGNPTVSGTFTSNGNSVNNRAFIRSSVKGTQRTLTAATVTVTYIDIQDLNGAGAGSWNISAVTGKSGDCGGNSNITFTTGIDCFWVSGTGNWSDATKWKTTSGGAGAARSPLPQDIPKLDSGSFTAGSQTVTLDSAMCPRTGGMVWTGATNTPALALTTATTFFGNILFISGMTISGTGIITYEGRANGTFTSGGLTLTANIAVDCTAAFKLSLGDNFTSSRNNAGAITATSGTFFTNGKAVSLTANGCNLNGGTIQVNSAFTSAAANFTATSGTLDIMVGGTFTYFTSITETGGTVSSSDGKLSWNIGTKTFSAAALGGSSGGGGIFNTPIIRAA